MLDSLWEVIVSRLVGSGVPSLWTDTCDLSRRAGVAGVNGRHSPVLKHGPRSLTCTRVWRVIKALFFSNEMRSESES